MTLAWRRIDPRTLGGLALLAVVLVAQGAALSESIKWAVPLGCLVVVALAVEVPIVPALGGLLALRVLIDHSAGEGGRVGIDPAAILGGLLILLAIGLLARRGRALAPLVGVALAIGFWTALAALSQGVNTEVLREGVRELSILAVAAIVLNSRESFTMAVAVRVVQVAGIAAALIAIYQVGTGGGMEIGGELRANGTFVHPNAAAVYFALATLASLWRYFEHGRGRADLLLGLAFLGATIATFSLDGFSSLLVMILTYGVVRSGSAKAKAGVIAAVAALILAFVATPVGSERIESQAAAAGSESLASRHGTSSSLEWRFYRWEMLLPEWERHPVLGKGLGTTTTLEGTLANTTAGNLPHSEYVRYLVETGVVGLALVLVGLLCLIGRLNRARRRACGPPGVAALGIAVIVGLMFNGLAANTLLYTPTAFAAALLVTTALRVSRAPARAELQSPPLDGHAPLLTSL